MKNILVTTDFSEKSKAGLRFAIQLASQHTCNLTFFHAYHLLIPASLDHAKIETYQKAEAKKIQITLNLFVEKIYSGMNIVAAHRKCIIKNTVLPQSSIIEYAAKNHFDFICISTRGAGKLERFFGTNTANIISYSAVPVIAVPYNYKSKTITSILYASDLVNLERELKKVVGFAKPLKAKVELLHFTSPLEKMFDLKTVEMVVKKLSKYNIKLNIKNSNFMQGLLSKIEAAITKTKPSMIIMFTEQNRTLFQKLFFSSNSAAYSYHPKIPLLVFNKS
ncbi:MAG: universal stress protein [Parafilimonas sp.]